jgi:hypothetical protein
VTQFDYLCVPLSIIIGLAMTQILKGFRGILLSRARVKLYWPSLVWALLLLAVCSQTWWAQYEMRKIPSWTFPGFSIVELQTVILYMLAAVVFPDFFDERGTDLRTHYFTHARWFFSLFVALIVTSLLKDPVLGGHIGDPVNVAFHFFFIALSLVTIVFRREWVHKTMSIVAVAVFAVYTMTLFANLK